MPIKVTRNREESLELQAAGEKSLNESIQRIDAIDEKWFEDFTIEPGSALEDADRWTQRQRHSEQVIYLAVSSRDHLRMLSNYIKLSKAAPPLPGYTLIRTSIESASLAIWLLTGGTLDKRVLASLRLAWHNAKDVQDWAARSGVSDAKEHADLERDLIAAKDARGGNRQYSLDAFPSWTTIVKTSEQKVTYNASLSPLNAWKAASGFSHSNMTIGHSFLAHHEIPGVNGEPSRPRMSTRLSTLAVFVLTAIHHLECLQGLMEDAARSAHPPR